MRHGGLAPDNAALVREIAGIASIRGQKKGPTSQNMIREDPKVSEGAWLISFAADYVIKGAVPNRDRCRCKHPLSIQENETL